jgi:photosystem II stability/assembly factor-like uncharacterized protein
MTKPLNLLCCLFFWFCSIPALCALGAQDKTTETKSDKPDASKPAKKLEELVDGGLVGALKFRSIGPAFMSGRISDIALDPTNPNIWYVGAGSGNLWKTTNAGTTFSPIFDNYDSYAIGCITVDAKSSEVVWVGTGENVGGRHIGFGDGVYRSRDGGASFENLGLKSSGHLSKILIDPRNSDVVFVAAQGPLWSPGGDRGLFKSNDGGKTWKNVLSSGPYTGATDVVLDPTNPDVMYAALHQRHRTVWALLNTGPESGIYKSVDGGETWRELKAGLPGDDKGKIGLGISPQKNNVIYAAVETTNRTGGFYRSDNFGESWTKMSSFVSGGTGPHYYQEIYLDPHRFDVIYHANDMLMRSVDGGKNFVSIEGAAKHVDNHDVEFHPTDPNFVLVCTDGGVYVSSDFAKTYRYISNLPLAQFYKIDVDYDLPFYHVIGGTQDNFTQYGPVATRFVQGITNADWMQAIGGDGHDNAIDPTNPDLIYCESQEGFLQRFDRKTMESISIRPQPAAGESEFRFNWDSPVLISPHNPKRIYFGSRMLHRSDDQGDSWTTVSPDLSRQKDRWSLPIMGRVWGIDAGLDLFAMSAYGNITSISESPLAEGLIYVGTDDGLVQVTEDGGKNWRRIERFFDVPEGAFVNDVKADRHDPDTVYVCLDHHKTGDFKPYLLKSSDRGRTWSSLSSTLPDRHLVWRLEQDHVNRQLLFLGTEFGLFASVNGGQKWFRMSQGMPTIPIRDLAIQKRENDLLCATFGRGIFVLDDYTPLREATVENLDAQAHLFSVRRSWWYRQADRLGGRKGFQGDSYFTADNPTYGAVFTVHFKDGFKSKQEKRKEEEQAAKKEKRDAKVATIEELEAEENELRPRRYLQISTPGKEFVARIDLPNSKGMHRVAWDFRQAPLFGTGFGPLAPPGEYLAAVIEWTGTETNTLCGPVTFKVEPMLVPTLPAVDPAEALAFQKSAQRLNLKLRKSTRRLAKVESTLQEARRIAVASAVEPGIWLGQIRELELEAKRLDRRLNGNQLKNSRAIEDVPSPSSRLMNALFGTFGSTHGPTKTHRESLQIAEQELGTILPEIDQLYEVKLAELRRNMADAGLQLEEQD